MDYPFKQRHSNYFCFHM